MAPFWALLPKLGPKMNFPGKKGSVSFSIFELPTNVPKIRKTSLFHQFLCEIQPILESCDWLKNPAIWLAKSILGHISGARIFPNMKFVQAYKNYSNINFHYRPNWWKYKELRKKTKFFQRTLGLSYFPHFRGKTWFSKNLAAIHNTTWAANTMWSSRKN